MAEKFIVGQQFHPEQYNNIKNDSKGEVWDIEIKQEMLDYSRAETTNMCPKNLHKECDEQINTIEKPNVAEIKNEDDKVNNLQNILIPKKGMKAELLVSHGYQQCDNTTKENPEICNVEDITVPKKEVKSEFVESNNNEIFHNEEGDTNLEFTKLVKNPLAFLKKSSNSRKYVPEKQLNETNKYNFVNTTIKSELIQSDEDIKTTTPSTPKIQTINIDKIKTTAEELLKNVKQIQLNEYIIKPESLPNNESSDSNWNLNFYDNCLNQDINLSLPVNANGIFSSNIVDVDETRSKQSHISLNSSQGSTKNYPITNISSELPKHKAKTIMCFKNTTAGKLKQTICKIKRKRALYNLRQRSKIRGNHTGRKSWKRKPTIKNKKKSKKYTEKDTAFRSKNVSKNLPKTEIQTRTKENERTNKTPSISADKCDYPKPFKTEMSSPKEINIATELPKPIMLKSESLTHVNRTKSYQDRQYQPRVRLKRIKSEELLVPLKIKRTNKLRKVKPHLNRHQMASENKRDFVIQQAFSLNPYIKLKRLSSANFCPFASNRITTTAPLNKPYDIKNEPLADTESTYFTEQESLSFLHSPSPNNSSILSGQLDSGISTSTSNTLFSYEDNSTVLLEIAAERAFINNHLMHFGYSPLQFELFNDLNDLNIFLKYVFGRQTMN